MGVEVRTGARVNEVTRDGVRLADACFVPVELVVWAAGSQSALVLRDFDGLEVNRINRGRTDIENEPQPRHLKACSPG